jgi:hypothetical protein
VVQEGPPAQDYGREDPAERMGARRAGSQKGLVAKQQLRPSCLRSRRPRCAQQLGPWPGVYGGLEARREIQMDAHPQPQLPTAAARHAETAAPPKDAENVPDPVVWREAPGLEEPKPVEVQPLRMGPMAQDPGAGERLSGLAAPVVLDELLHPLSSHPALANAALS